MTDSDDLDQLCPYQRDVRLADCMMCAEAGCRFHRPDQLPCDCTVEQRHRSYRDARDGVKIGDYQVGSIAAGVQAMADRTPGKTRIRAEGGPADGWEYDEMDTVGGRPATQFRLRGELYERVGNQAQPDGRWLYRHRGRTARLPVNDTPLPPLPGRVIQDVPLPPPIPVEDRQEGRVYRSGELRPPDAPIPEQPSMGGAQPIPPAEELRPGHHWARCDNCAGVGCDRCNQRGWVDVETPEDLR